MSVTLVRMERQPRWPTWPGVKPEEPDDVDNRVFHDGFGVRHVGPTGAVGATKWRGAWHWVIE